LIDESLSHNHACTEESILLRQAISNSAKRKGLEDICQRPSKILHRKLKNYDLNLTHNDCNLIRKNIYNARKAIQPKIPKNIDEVHNVLNDLKLTTNRDENFLLVNDKVSNIIIFSTVENLKLLCS